MTWRPTGFREASVCAPFLPEPNVTRHTPRPPASAEYPLAGVPSISGFASSGPTTTAYETS